MNYFDNNLQNRAITFTADRTQLPGDREPAWAVRSAIDGINKVIEFGRADNKYYGVLTSDQWSVIHDVRDRLKTTQGNLQEPQAHLYP